MPILCVSSFTELCNDDTVLVVDGEVKIRPSPFKAFEGRDLAVILQNLFDHKTVFDSNSNGYSNFFEAVSKKQLFFKAQKADLTNAILSPEFFSLLLSPITQIFHCFKLTLTPTITFAEILKKLPNLEDLSLMDTNIEIGNKWVEDLKIYGKNIVKLNIEINDLNFSAKELAKIIKVCA